MNGTRGGAGNLIYVERSHFISDRTVKMDEAYASIALGVCVGLGVVLFMPNDPRPKKKSIQSSPAKSTATTSTISPVAKEPDNYEEADDSTMDKSVKKTLQKKPHLQKFFGVHVEPPTEAETEEDEGSDWDMLALVVRFFFIVGFCIVMCVLLNLSTNGDFGRFVLGMFPVEMEALKLTSLLQRFKMH